MAETGGLAETAEIEAWERRGRDLAESMSRTAWDIGDWMAYAEAKWGEKYRRAAEITGLNEQHLRNCAWVARRFEMSSRGYKLSFGHYRLVAAIPQEAAHEWLALAEAEHWPIRTLEKELRTVRQLPPGRPEIVVATYKLTIPQDHDQRWRRAAERQGLEVEDWVVSVCDEAASVVGDSGRGRTAA